MHTKTLTAAFVLTLGFSHAALADAYFAEHDFEPGSWSEATPFWAKQPTVGETFSATSARFQAGNPANNFMVTQYMIDVPQDVVNFAAAPAFMTGWTYDPGTEGTIESISARVTTIPVIPNGPGNHTTMRLYLYQSGHIYINHGSSDWLEFELHDDSITLSFDNVTEGGFFEIVPNSKMDGLSHPDFAGDQIQFAIGYFLHSGQLEGLGTVGRAGGFDDAIVRISSVPEPGSLVLLSLGGLALSLRRMMR